MTATEDEAALLLEYFIAKYVSEHPDMRAVAGESFDQSVETAWGLLAKGYLKVVCQRNGDYRIERRMPACPPVATIERPPLMARLRLHRRIGVSI